MKYYETHFEEYLSTCVKDNYHPSLLSIPRPAAHLPWNVLFYGPPGVGKYTQVLMFLQSYSPSKLRYEKKISLVYNKQTYLFKISDIHFEIDMSLMGCNSKALWNEIYQQIIDILLAKKKASVGFIVCKYFHDIHGELLESFYSYMQKNAFPVTIHFILITEHLSFLPDNIVNTCKVISVPRPKSPLHHTSNLKYANTTSFPVELANPHLLLCAKITRYLNQKQPFSLAAFRDVLYDMLIYNINVYECAYEVFCQVVHEKISPEEIKNYLSNTYIFFTHFNNNYRPIYHLERYFLGFIKVDPTYP
jgi:DNA polymerase III delta prime subunit